MLWSILLKKSWSWIEKYLLNYYFKQLKYSNQFWVIFNIFILIPYGIFSLFRWFSFNMPSKGFEKSIIKLVWISNRLLIIPKNCY